MARGLVLAIVLVMAIECADPGVLDQPPEHEDSCEHCLVHRTEFLLALFHVIHFKALIKLAVVPQLFAMLKDRIVLPDGNLLLPPHDGEYDGRESKVGGKENPPGECGVVQEHEDESDAHDGIGYAPYRDKFLEFGQ